MDADIIWRPVASWPGYMVTCDGQVRSPRGRILSPYHNNGYLAVKIWDGKRHRTAYIHQLVADAFLGPCPDGKEVNHKDMTKANNSEDNLEYLTHRANMHHYAEAQGFTCHAPYRLPPELWVPVPTRLAKAFTFCQAIAAKLPT